MSQNNTKLALYACMALVLAGASNAFAIDSYTGEGTPILGGKVIATGGDVIATFVSGGGFYDNYLYVSSPSTAFTNSPNTSIGANWIFENHITAPGATVNLGSFAPGTELIFNVLADTHGTDFSQQGTGYLNWYTGPASRNADGYAHAFVDPTYTGPYGGTFVGFEDLANLGDAGYEDLRYTFSNVTGVPSVPEPAFLACLSLGVAGLAAARRRKSA